MYLNRLTDQDGTFDDCVLAHLSRLEKLMAKVGCHGGPGERLATEEQRSRLVQTYCPATYIDHLAF